MVKFEFSNIWQELKQLSGKIEEIQKNFATKDDIKKVERRIERLEKMILGLSITIISSILMFFIPKIFIP